MVSVANESKGRGWFPEPLKIPSETLIEPLSNPRQCPTGQCGAEAADAFSKRGT